MSRARATLLITTASVGLLVGPIGNGTAHADKPRLLVLDVEGPSMTPAARSTFAQGVMSGLSASGVDALRAADVKGPPGTARGCADVACWNRLLADPLQAPAYVVRPTVSVTGSTYQLRVEVLDPKTARVVEAREDSCEICTDTEAAEALGMTASAVKAEVFRKNPVGAAAVPAAAPPQTAPSGAAPATTPRGTGSATVAGADVAGAAKTDTGSSSGARPIVGWTLIGSATAAIVTGIVLLVIDGKIISSSCPAVVDVKNPCRDVHGTKAWGWVAIGSGLAAGAVGGWLLVTGPTAHDGRVETVNGWSMTMKRAF